MIDSVLFWTKAAAIGQIAGALATLAAVLVSLWVVLSERRESIRLSVGRRIIIGGGAPEIRVVSFEVVNTGVRPISVSGFGWRSGWLRRGPEELLYRWAIQTPDVGLPSQNPPFNLEPGHKASFLIRLDRFEDSREAEQEQFGRREIPLLGSSAPKICGTMYTSRGTRVIVRIEKELERTFRNLLDNGPQPADPA